MKLFNKDIKLKKFHMNKMTLIIGILVGVAVFLSISGAALAKYYAKRDNKGVSVASGLYFNSNCISNVSGDIDISLDQIDLQTVPGYVNPEGGNIFYLEIRNYDNYLLYNELYLDLQYTIEFLKINGKTAVVEYIDNQGVEQNKELADGEIFTLTGREIEGGSAKYHSYVVKTTNAEDDTNAKVLVRAYPTAPDYVAVAAKNMRLLGVLTAQPKDVKVGIDKDNFLIADTAEYINDWKKVVENMSGLEYTIQTNGDDVSTGDVKGELEVTWNSKMLDINQFDPYYIQAMNELKETPEEYEKFMEQEIKTITIKVLPYSNVKITFYKTDDFVAHFNDDTVTGMTKEEFENYVTAALAASE